MFCHLSCLTLTFFSLRDCMTLTSLGAFDWWWLSAGIKRFKKIVQLRESWPPYFQSSNPRNKYQNKLNSFFKNITVWCVQLTFTSLFETQSVKSCSSFTHLFFFFKLCQECPYPWNTEPRCLLLGVWLN